MMQGQRQGQGQGQGLGQGPGGMPFSNGFPPPAGGGPIQMNMQPTQQTQQSQQSMPQTQFPGPMSVQNGNIPAQHPQNSQTINTPAIGFNGGVQSSF